MNKIDKKIFKSYNLYFKMENNTMSFKVVLLGSSGVGKTSILTQFNDHVFRRIIAPTVGSGMITKDIETNAGTVSLRIWDTAGEERYRAFTGLYSRSAMAGIIVFDITDASSFNELPVWINVYKLNADNVTFLYLVGNKTDLCDNRAIETEKVKQFARENEMRYFEVSAKTGENIEYLFHELAEELSTKVVYRDTSDKEVDFVEENNDKKCC